MANDGTNNIYTADDMAGTINNIESYLNEIITAIQDIDLAITNSLQNASSTGSLYGIAGYKLLKAWEENTESLEGWDEVFNNWVESLKEIYKINNEALNAATQTYANED